MPLTQPGTVPNVIQPLNPSVLPPATGNYTHGTLVESTSRMVFVSGQVPWDDADGQVPADFAEQCRQTWRNVLAVLAEADMGVPNLAKVTTYLASRDHRAVNSQIRAEVLGDHTPALTIIIADIYRKDWLLEIEAIAVA
jgi:2-iminobutanoate/2-iminopropanoate deaminase